MKIQFCGASERVTGSNYFVDTGKNKFIVDCGLFQGNVDDEKENWDDFSYNPSEIDFAIITHSHLDHIGRLPFLYKKGFRGKIYATKPTYEFTKLFLEDSYNISISEAEKTGENLHYSMDDVNNVLNLIETYDYYNEIDTKKDALIKFYDAGHILGSAIVEIKTKGKTIIFSGDLGNPPVPILKDTDFIEKTDYLIMESTYGDRNHEPFEERAIRLERVVEKAIHKGGVLLIPAFAMERTQEIIYELNDLIETGKISKIPVYIDSPLALKVTEAYKKYISYFDTEAKALVKTKKDLFAFSGLKFINNVEESKELDRNPDSKIIIAGSGMSTGGKILFHEKRYLPEASTTFLVIGFQVKGTLGRQIADGENVVNILGEQVKINAEIEAIESFSAHADQERLVYWVSKYQEKPKKIFLVHGEKKSQISLKHRLEDEEGIETIIPKFKETFEL